MGSNDERGSRNRPRVVVSATMSVDGRLALGRDRPLISEENGRVWRSVYSPSADHLASARSSQLTELYHPEAVIEGSGTFVPGTAGPVGDLPEPSLSVEVLLTDFLPEEKANRPGHESWFTVVDSRGRVRWEMTGDGGVDLLVLVARSTPPPYLAYLRRERICYLVVGEDRVDLPLALGRMRERLGVTCVVSEAGGGLNGALLRAGLVDEIQLLVLPAVVGGLGTPALFDGSQLLSDERPTSLRLLSSHAEADGMLWLRYEVLPERPAGRGDDGRAAAANSLKLEADRAR